MMDTTLLSGWGVYDELDVNMQAALLQARADALAQPIGDEALGNGAFEVVEFKLGDETYAVPAALVVESFALKELTPLPCVPSFVVGIINVRGQIFSVIDVRHFLGLPPAETAARHNVILLRSGAMELGIMVDSIVGVRSIIPGEMLGVQASLGDGRTELISGVTADHVTLLNMERLLADDKLIVDDDAAMAA